MMAAPIYIPNNSAQVFLFLDLLANTYSWPFDDSHSDGSEMLSHCGFDLRFSDIEQKILNYTVPRLVFLLDGTALEVYGVVHGMTAQK